MALLGGGGGGSTGLASKLGTARAHLLNVGNQLISTLDTAQVLAITAAVEPNTQAHKVKRQSQKISVSPSLSLIA